MPAHQGPRLLTFPQTYAEMRLLHDDGNRNLRLAEYNDGKSPPYTILSYTRGPDSQEVTLKDITEGTSRRLASKRPISTESELLAMAHKTSKIRVVLISRAAPSLARPLTRCSTSIKTRTNVTSFYRTSRYLVILLITSHQTTCRKRRSQSIGGMFFPRG